MANVKLRQCTLQDSSLLRYWRNQEHVASQMIQKDLVALQDHNVWFSEASKKQDRLYIYSDGEKDVGSFQITHIKDDKSTCRCGIYVGDIKYQSSVLNVAAAIYMYDIVFNEIKVELALASVVDSNRSALLLNKSLGFVKCSESRGSNFSFYSLDKYSFMINKSRLVKLFNHE